MIKTNVMSSEAYRNKIACIVDIVSNHICRTLGPCGSYTLIEKMGSYALTKDGHHVLTNLIIEDSETTMTTQVLNSLKLMAGRMVRMVGDGSSTTCVAASKFITGSKDLYGNKAVRPTELTNRISACINKTIETIRKNATQVTDENIVDVMYKTAFVSTNGDEKFSQMIADIYKEHRNVVFNVISSKKMEEKTHYNVIKGYRIEFMRVIDKIFNNKEGCLELENCPVVVFDHNISIEHMRILDAIQQEANIGNNNGTVPLVVVATGYDQGALDIIKRTVVNENTAIKSGILRNYSRYYLSTSVFDKASMEALHDFAVVAGSEIIMQEDSNKMIGKLYGEEPTIDMDVIRASIGNVESIVVDGDTRKTIITGGAGYGSEKYNALVRNIANDFKNISDECNSNMGGFSSKEYLDIKNRYHSLVSNIVEVIVGGENTLDIVMRADAADDATKACESVIQNGYNVGGTISIIRAALELLKGNCDEIDVEIYDHIRRAFRETTQEIFFNKYFGADRDRRNFVVPSDKTIEINNIIDTAVSKGIMYDLVKEEYNEDIINSALTDIEVLRGAISFANHLLSANQYVSISALTEVQ